MQPAVLDRTVVAHLCPPDIGDVLTDRLINLFVVINTVGSWRHEKRQCDAERGKHREPRELTPVGVTVDRGEQAHGYEHAEQHT